MDTKLIEDTLNYIQHLEDRLRAFDICIFDRYESLNIVNRLAFANHDLGVDEEDAEGQE
jgi:hypothetical protein